MKVLAVVLLCAFVAVQGRSAPAGLKSGSRVSLGDAPFVVHERIAVSTSGFLESAVGTLIDNRWILTSAEAFENARFIWNRYGAVNVITPQLVTEASAARISPDGVLALININRYVEATDNISPIGLGSSVAESGYSYSYGKKDDGTPGENLSVFSASLSLKEDGSFVATSEEGAATKFDLGAPLVSDGSLVGVLIAAGDDTNAGVFANVANYVSWIEEETELDLSSRAQDDGIRVKFVN